MSLVPIKLPDFDSLRDALREKGAEIHSLTEDNAALKNELRMERVKNAKLEIGVKELRTTLMPLYSALQMIFGVMDDMDVATAAGPTPVATAKSAVWDSWKKKLGGKPAEAIDVLMLHGEMNAKQLRLHLRCGNDYIYNVISKLWTAGVINKHGGRISLKEL